MSDPHETSRLLGSGSAEGGKVTYGKNWDGISDAAVDNNNLNEEIALLKQQIQQEKAGKRKLFHSLVKISKELKRTQTETSSLVAANAYANQTWYEGGLWRAPQVLPSVEQATADSSQQPQQLQQEKPQDRRLLLQQLKNDVNMNNANSNRIRLRSEAISLSELFLDLVIVTAFTRVGVAISNYQSVNLTNLAYFAVFWTIWSKEASYSSRFDTTDLSAQMTTLLTCFAVLFGSLSCTQSSTFNTEDSTRIMMVAGFVSLLHFLLHIRVAYWNWKEMREAMTEITNSSFGSGDGSDNSNKDNNNKNNRKQEDRFTTTQKHIRNYALLNVILTFCESSTWLIGAFAVPVSVKNRGLIFLVGILFALRVPRAFLANDFHAACSKRGVLFILLLGFLLQSIVVVASDFFAYDFPSMEQYAYIGAACLMMFCIKLLYVDDSDTMVQDHAMLVSRVAAFLFNVGQFCLLLSTTVMGSGLNLLTHDYLAAAAALPSQAKLLVVGGFSATVLSTFFIKSMHMKRIPVENTRDRNLFIGAYAIQAIVTLLIVAVTAAMGLSQAGDFLQSLIRGDMQCLLVLSGLALLLVVVNWLDEWVELSIYNSAEDSRLYRVHPFGLWFCLKPEVTDQQILDDIQQHQDQYVGSIRNLGSNTANSSGSFARYQPRQRLSGLSPLLGSSVADLIKAEQLAEFDLGPPAPGNV